ncbi:MAG: condensation domain-containing protein, partial [Myxococcales bacterium]|nr:condensation domain-containing protein [Myxococcales bacterium]
MRHNEERLSLSHGQAALWFLARLVPGMWAYNIVLPVVVRGPLNARALERALNHVIRRHPSLRTSFQEDGGTPFQTVLPDSRAHIAHVDASTWNDRRVRDHIQACARTPFDLGTDAAPRISLIRRGADHHTLVLVVHHILVDLWSLVVIMDELRQLYAAEVTGLKCELPPLHDSYQSFVRRQTAALAGDRGEVLKRFWKGQLERELPVLNLPTDYPRPRMRSFRGGTVTHRMPSHLTSALKNLAGKERSTLFMALLAAYEILLGRTAGQEAFAIGSPTLGRDRAELQGVVGDFVNMVPFLADLSGRPSFRVLLQRVRENTLATVQHADYPFSLLTDLLALPRNLSRPPVFQTTFVLQRFH